MSPIDSHAVSTFSVGITRNGLGGSGRLSVERNQLRLVPGATYRRLMGMDQIAHQGGAVELVHLRALPFFICCAVPFRDPAGAVEAVARFPVWSRKAIRAALHAAGHDVHELERWATLPTLPHEGAERGPQSPS